MTLKEVRRYNGGIRANIQPLKNMLTELNEKQHLLAKTMYDHILKQAATSDIQVIPVPTATIMEMLSLADEFMQNKLALLAIVDSLTIALDSISLNLEELGIEPTTDLNDVFGKFDS